ncbi:MAG: hypothetical protein ACJAWT_000138 [Glaciecola sp.]|jgi:hypothetical protein
MSIEQRTAVGEYTSYFNSVDANNMINVLCLDNVNQFHNNHKQGRERAN